jgi:uncharacterized membrane protein
MRTTRDRIRHAVLFELIALVIVTPVGGLIFGISTVHFGVIAVFAATTAMAWNYIYNLSFDHVMLRLFEGMGKTLRVRIIHAALFEAGFISLLIPFIAWYLGVSLWQAFVMNASLAGFYLVYAFAYNWAYDVVFPVAIVETAA